MICEIHLSPFSIIKFISEKNQNVAIVSFFRSFERAKTIVDHRVRLWWKPLKNHWCQWSISEKTFNGDGPGMVKPLKNHRCQWLILPGTIDGDGENFQRPSPFHRWRKTTIAIPSPLKIYHRSSLEATNNGFHLKHTQRACFFARPQKRVQTVQSRFEADITKNRILD